MTIDAAQFRKDFTEFNSIAAYPDSGVTFWLGVAYLMLRPERWCTLLDTGAELFAAHNLALEAQAVKTAKAGGVPGIQTGAVSSKTVDRVGISYDAQAGLELDGGHWNLTIYGTRFLNMARMAGSGGVQLGAGCDFAGAILGGGGFWEGW